MRTIGITGPIASGKSSVGRFLTQASFPCLDCDKVTHELYETSECKDILQSRFGWGVFRADGSVDRKRLGEYAFDHPEVLDWLSVVMWPRVRERVELWLFAQKKKQAPAAFVLGSHLFGAGMTDLFAEIWLVTAQRETSIERLQARDHLVRATASQRYQLTRDKKIDPTRVSVIIRNQGTIPALHAQLKSLLRERNLL